jgi:hypothetical protein
MGEFSSKKINEIDDIYQSIYSCDNVKLDEQQSDVSKQWERGARWFGRVTDKYVANPVSSAVRSATDYVGQAGSGVVKAATGGTVDLEKIGKDAERVLSGGGGKPQSKPPVAKQSPPQTPKPTQSQDLGKRLGQWLVPPPEKSADPEVRSGRRTPSGIPNEKPALAKPRSTVQRDSKGAIIVNHFESDSDSLVTEAPAQVAPITGAQGKAWYQKSKSGNYVPITDPSLAKQASERWKDERAKPAAAKLPAVKPAVAPTPTPTPRLAPAPAPRAQARPSAPAPKPLETRMSSVTGKKEFVGTTSSGEKFERRAATRAELEAARKAREDALEAGKIKKEAEKAAVSAGISAPKTQKEERMDAFDLVLEYLLSEGHTDTLEEALYVMMEMDPETIQSICEAAADQSNKQIDRGVKTTYKAGNVLDNQHQGRSRGLNRLPATERAAKEKRMRGRLKARRDDLFGERNRREDAAREEIRKKYGL